MSSTWNQCHAAIHVYMPDLFFFYSDDLESRFCPCFLHLRRRYQESRHTSSVRKNQWKNRVSSITLFRRLCNFLIFMQSSVTGRDRKTAGFRGEHFKAKAHKQLMQAILSSGAGDKKELGLFIFWTRKKGQGIWRACTPTHKKRKKKKQINRFDILVLSSRHHVEKRSHWPSKWWEWERDCGKSPSTRGHQESFQAWSPRSLTFLSFFLLLMSPLVRYAYIWCEILTLNRHFSSSFV